MDSPETTTIPLPVLEPFKGVKRVPLEEYYTSGHRTCQGCESALVMKLMVKAAGPRTVVLGSTGWTERRQHDILQHALGRAVDAHAARLLGARRRSGRPQATRR